MYTTISVLLLLGVATSNVAASCNDIDPAACSALQGTLQDMCTEPCISDLCRKTCGMCPLTCYKCDNELYPEACSKTMECTSVHEYCVALQELTDEFVPLYHSGCADIDRCLKVFGEINVKRSYTLNGGCCDHDNCNFHDPELKPTDPSPIIVTRPVYPSGVDESRCSEQDIDEDFCTSLMQADPNICNKSCVAHTICATSCGTCRKCYDCQGVRDKANCLNTATCMKGQQCVTVQTFGLNFEQVYRLGCMNTSQCHLLFGVSLGGGGLQVGKRQMLRGGCCDNDLCQHAPLTTTALPSTLTTTMATFNTGTSPPSQTPSPTTTVSATMTTKGVTTMSPSATSASTMTPNGVTTMSPSATSASTMTPNVVTTMSPSASSASPMTSHGASSAQTMPVSTLPPKSTVKMTTTQSASVSEMTTVNTTMSADNTTMNGTSTEHLPPCKDYDHGNYCIQYVPLICKAHDHLSQKFAAANCAVSCNMCDKFYELVAAKEIVIQT